jgi:hypothetical protein
MISKQRKEFGKPYQFHDRDAMDTFHEFKNFKVEGELTRLQKNISVQVCPPLKTLGTQTTWYYS